MFYRFFSYLLFIVVLPFVPFFRKIREGFFERLGFREKGRGQAEIWLHGASAGDLLALLPMAQELKKRSPGIRIHLTTITNTGLVMGRKKFSGIADVAYAPYDIPFAVERRLRAVRPSVLVLEYTEIWPTLVRSAKDAGVKIILVNGRFGDRLWRYKLLLAVTGTPVTMLDLMLMKDEDEAEKAVALGAPRGRVRATGNTKFDNLISMALGPEPVELGRSIGAGQGRLVVFGSIHEGEEPIALDAFLKLRKEFPDLRALVAPRYPDRAGSIQAAAAAKGLKVVLRSGVDGECPACDMVILDTIGELAQAYRYCDIAFVGGSMTSRGGQNILEPAVHGKVVLFGPDMHNFKDCVNLLLGRGGIMVKDGEGLARVTAELLKRPSKLAELGRMARKCVLGISGATGRNVDFIMRLMDR